MFNALRTIVRVPSFVLVMLLLILLVVPAPGCASLPPGDEADQLRTEVSDFASSLNAVATAQLEDTNPANDETARNVQLVTAIVAAVLSGDTSGVTEPLALALIDLLYRHDLTGVRVLIAERVKDPYVAGIAVWFSLHLERWITASEADTAARVLSAPGP